MADYSDLNDAEIAQKVFFWVNNELCPKGGLAHFFNGEFFYSPAGEAAKKFDPCNSPADAWPIIEKKKIGVRNISGDLWECASPDGVKADYSSRPLRSSMIVFLMMQDEKHG